MRKPPPTVRRRSAAIHFRTEIEVAEAAGASREDMTLHLTLSDVSQLRRDSTLPIEDISFTGGEMRFLGVKVVQGGVTESTLNAAAGE